jgi:RNA polymerase sigma factor (sigma-70 family)
MKPERNLESTALLLARARLGDHAALESLGARYSKLLGQWAHGRLPRQARDSVDTDDLVQVTLIKAFRHLEDFEPRREGAFLAYVRRILLNQIRDHIRHARRRPVHEDVRDDLEDDAARSPLEEIIGHENVARYELALGVLSDRQREAVILRVELGLRYREVAEALGAPSVNAARMIVARALVHLAAVVEPMGGKDGQMSSGSEA